MNLILKKWICKSLLSPGLIFGVFFTASMIFVLPSAYSNIPKNDVLAILGAVGMSGLSLAIVAGWGISFSNIKNSSLLDRIIITKYSRWNLIRISLIPLFINILVMLTTFFGSLYIVNNLIGSLDLSFVPLGETKDLPKEPLLWSSISWTSLILSWIFNILVSTSLVFVLLAAFKTSTGFLSMSWLYIILGLLFGGATMPINILRGDDAVAAFKFIVYVVPQSYVNFFGADAMNNQIIEFSWSSADTIKNISAIAAMTTVFTISGLIGVRYWGLTNR